MIAGRQKIACVTGQYQKRLLAFRNGEIDLMVVRDRRYIACVCAIDDSALIKTTDVVGVDVGIVNIATDSDGKCCTGEAIEKVRARLLRRRAGLQRRATKPAKRRLLGQLRQFVAYKARLAGVPVLYVDPRHTSKACSCCGCIGDRNRPGQATFSSISCGHAEPADLNAARNTRARATVTVLSSDL
jgi:transposase